MKNIPDWIDKIIEDLVEPSTKLSDTLLKVQVLAFKIENTQLKEWVNLEINGYVGKERPDYRKIPTVVKGNLIQDAGFQGIWTKKSVSLPVEYLDQKYWDVLMSIKMDSSVSELEKMVADKGSYQVNLPHAIAQEFSKIMNPWHVDSAWQKISNNSIEGILSTIKSTLLNFLLELNKEFGDNDNLSIMKKKDEVESIFNKTIGTIKSDNVNISIGNKTAQAVNYGDKSQVNVGAGDNVTQSINAEMNAEIQEFIDLLKKQMANLGLDIEEKEDIINEVARVETQIARESPKTNIINGALSTIKGILTGIAANAYTPIVLEKLGDLMSKF
ncbi:hypothetical protein [Flagellimonas pelagia]|uniref:AbiTii domain-containing protein n=1 Tax=Flagellimonas pelagia TaxID=2306998 RepID=A0A3A1NRA1_9FLAO|nr:hypothetical protein [Allomuricauda maritima]RIV46474.1 hypothetical protein D2V05_03760 [Allomuricauda maritima]TXJ99135.1 hypothetical protein FQ017_03740 [Allomuricauda maritima]